MKVTTSWGKCELYVEGIDFKCPLCGANVPSVYKHECERDGGVTTQRTRRSRALLAEIDKEAANGA